MGHLLGWTSAAACLLGTSLLLGQPRGKGPRQRQPEKTIAAPPSATSKPPKPEEDAPAAEPSAQAPFAEPPSAAGRPSADAGARPSPLNPRPEELSYAGPLSMPPDLEKVLGEIALLRARVAAVGDALFKSRLVLRVTTRGDHAKIGRMAISLDEGVVYTAPAGFSAEDEATVYEHAVAPGRHVLGVDVDRRDDREEAYRTAQHARVTLEVPENQRLEATIRIEDDSDMGASFPADRKGSYDLRVRVRASSRK